MKVADFIYPVTGLWDKEFIDSTFFEVDRGRILRILLGSNVVEDRLVWYYSKEGRFSVWASSGVVSLRWPEIWSLPIPPKICMFLWRACVGILPHKVELFRLHIVGSELESIYHVG